MEGSGLGQKASVSFDAATFEIWGSLLNGGQLVVMQGHEDISAELGAVLQRHEVNVLWLTSSLFNLLVENHHEHLRGVEQLLVGGEALSVPHIHRALELLPGTELINGYGPTENTTFTCCYRIERRHYAGSIPIGRPISNPEVLSVDKRGEWVAGGIVDAMVKGGGVSGRVGAVCLCAQHRWGQEWGAPGANRRRFPSPRVQQ